MFRLFSRKTAARICPPAFRRGLRLEWLEGRDVPATFFVDDTLVAGTSISALNTNNAVFQVIDVDNSTDLSAGDTIRVTLPGQSTATDFTFQTSVPGTVNATDKLAFSTASAALTAANDVAGTDTVYLGPGTYGESLNVNSTVNLIGLGTAATQVVIDPTSGDGVTVSADGVSISNLLITGAADGITASTGVTNLTLTNVTVGADNPVTSGTTESNTGIGLNLTGTGTGTLTLDNVTLTGNAGQALNVSGFATVDLSGLSVTAAGGAPVSSIDLGASTANATLNVSLAGTTGQTVTVSGTSLQIGTGEAISLANVDALNITGSSGNDTFNVTAPASGTGATAITINGGAGTDTLNLTNGAATFSTDPTYSASGFSGSVSASGTASVSFSGIEQFTGGSTLTGRVFVDGNNNQQLDSGESGVAGVTVYLDANGNNTLDAGEITAVTDSTGAYSFTGLPTGSFRVRVVANGLTLTTTASPAAVNVSTFGQSGLPAVNFGVSSTNLATVTGTLFGDTNGNGTQDSGETGISGATVYVDLDNDGQLDGNEPSALTGSNGAFTISTTATGTYTLRVAAPLPTGFALPATLPTVTLTAGQSVTKNLGLTPTGSSTVTGGTVTGTIFADVVTQNGTRDSGENGVRGVTVYLDLNGNGRLDRGEPTAVTDQSGNYTLRTTADVTNAAVRVVLSPGYLRSTTTPTVSLSAGNTVSGTNIGLITNLPPQATPSRRLAAGYIVGGKAHVKVFDNDGDELRDIPVFAGLATQDVRVTVADVTGDGIEDVIVGTGPGVPTQVIVLDGTNLQTIATLTPFEAGFTGGVYVAAGDVNQDGINDVIVTPDQGGGPRVLAFQGGPAGASTSFTQIASFFGIDDPNFRGGCRVSVADLNRDGVADLVVAAGFGGGPRVAFFDGNSILSGLTRLFNDIFVFEQTLRNGVYVTAGDLDGDGFADLIVGGGPGGGPRVLALNGHDLVSGNLANPGHLVNFFAGNSSDRGGVRVVAKDTDGDGKVEIYTGAGDNESGKVRKFHHDGSEDSAFESDKDFGGTRGVFVG